MNATRKIFTGAIAALALTATFAATVTPAEAGQRHRHRGGGNGGAIAAGIIGGLALGALAAGAAHASPSYGAPRYYSHSYSRPVTYASPVYVGQTYDVCYRKQRPAFNRWGDFIGYRIVTVCE